MGILASASNPVVDAMTSSLTETASDAMSGIGSIIPVAMGVLGAILVVGIGIKVFKKITGK